MDEGQAQGEEPVRRSQGGDVSGGVDLLDNHDGHLRSSPGPLSPDENRNRLMEEDEEVEQGPRGVGRGRLCRQQQQQDSVNNNGSCEEEEEEVEEEDDSSKVEVEEEEDEEKMEGDSDSGAFSPDLDSQIRDSSSCSPTGVEELVSSPEECSLGKGVEDHAEEGDALRSRGDRLPCSPRAAALDLGEPWDHALLPQRLHQIAEALVHEEDYERAIRFIQLERLYHERLLANLATLQEQWEYRWRGSGAAQSPSAERTPIDPDQLDRLSHICRTHRQPSLRAEQCETADKVQKNSLIVRQTRVKEGEKERLSTPLLPCGTGSGADSTQVTMEQEKHTRERETSPQHTDSTDSSSALSHQMASESSPCQPSPHPPTATLIGSSGLTDSPPSNGFAPEGRVEVVLSAAAAAVVEAVLAGETKRDGRPAKDIPEAPAVAAPVIAATDASRSANREGPGEEERQALPPPPPPQQQQQQQHQEPHTQPLTQPSVSQHMEPTHSTHTPDELLSHTTTTTTTTSVSHTQQQQPKAGAGLLGLSQSEERTAGDGEEEEELEEEEEEEEVAVEEEEEEEEVDEAEVEEAEEALELEEEGGGGGGGGGRDGERVDLDVPEEIPEYERERERNQVVGVETVEPVKVATLDDMAKRIQVEEITPASGLVSILKRRASLEGTSPSRHTPKPKALTKRKVRFREPDDGFDQEEVSGDSWVLLLLLCLATVVISVGGTALYCTVGDAQSSVCTDFSHNMDFYVGQVQRGMAELKHWFSPSS